MIGGEQPILAVLSRQRDETTALAASSEVIGDTLDAAIQDAERLLVGRGVKPFPASCIKVAPPLDATSVLRTWEEILTEAETSGHGDACFSDLLNSVEIDVALARLSGCQEEFRSLHRLRAQDYIVAGVAGSLAGLIDVLLVAMPRRAGLLGGTRFPGGWLSNGIKDGFSDLLPPDIVKALEKAFPVPFDPSTNNGLASAVAGLSPGSHRLQSLGHDPLLGWIFGVIDVLEGGFTAVGADGKFVFQFRPGASPEDTTVSLITGIIEAFVCVGGHMLSDVATPAGLPPPLFGLLQMLQTGEIGGRSVADWARTMYRAGYDFRHFLAGGIAVLLADLIVRFAWMADAINGGASLKEALPIGRKPRLQLTLLLAHSVATTVNLGKFAFTKNPLSLNWAQWLTFFGYLLPHVHWVLVGKEQAMAEVVNGRLDDDFVSLQRKISDTWSLVFGSG